MISLKNPEQIGKMRDAGALLYEVLCRLREAVQPGMSTAALNVYAEQLIRKNHAIPSFLHYEGYPASICASIDDAVVMAFLPKSRFCGKGRSCPSTAVWCWTAGKPTVPSRWALAKFRRKRSA